MVDIPGWKELRVVNTHCVVGEGMCKARGDWMATVAKVVEGRPMVLWAADWNVIPEAVRASGWHTAVGATLMLPRQATYLCGKTDKVIDYFVGRGIAPMVERVDTDLLWPRRPHRPVRLSIGPEATRLQMWVAVL